MADSAFPNLLAPLTIRGCRLKNRIFSTGHMTTLVAGGAPSGLAMVALGKMPTKWPGLAVAASDNDDYYLSSDNPKNSPMTYFSPLKLKVRKATGRFDSSAMRVLVLENGAPVIVSGR